MVLDPLQAAKERASARTAALSQEEIRYFSVQQEAEAKYRVLEPSKTDT